MIPIVSREPSEVCCFSSPAVNSTYTYTTSADRVIRPSFTYVIIWTCLRERVSSRILSSALSSDLEIGHYISTVNWFSPARMYLFHVNLPIDLLKVDFSVRKQLS